jgi:tight adherence protein C
MRLLALLGGFTALLVIPWVLASAFRSPIGPRVDIARLSPTHTQRQAAERTSLLHGVGALFVGLVSDARRTALDTSIAQAGRPEGWTVERIIGMRVLLILAFGGLGILRFASRPDLLSVFVIVVGAGIGWVAPERLVAMKGQDRQLEIRTQLADVVDQLAVMVKAGMSLDSAFMHVSQTLTGVMGDELGRVVQDIRMGVPRREALFSMAQRMNVPELDMFVRAVAQSDELGVPIADTLKSQATEMRVRRRQHAEETAMKLPVKVLMPTMLCIVPALLIVVVGPAIISLVDTLGS